MMAYGTGAVTVVVLTKETVDGDDSGGAAATGQGKI